MPRPSAKLSALTRAASLGDLVPSGGATPWSDELEELAVRQGDGWAAAPDTRRFLARLVLTRGLKNVLEIGAGASSVTIAAALAHRGGGSLTSIESNPAWCADAWAVASAFPSVETTMVKASPTIALGRPGLYYRYPGVRNDLAARAPFDLIFVDGPQGYYGRDGALPILWDHLAPGALIVLDDAGRIAEQRTLLRWIAIYQRLELLVWDPEWGGRGIAMLEVTAPLRPRFAPEAFLGGLVRGVVQLARNLRAGR